MSVQGVPKKPTFAGPLVLVEAGLECVEVAAEVVVLQLVAELPHGGQLGQQGTNSYSYCSSHYTKGLDQLILY